MDTPPPPPPRENEDSTNGTKKGARRGNLVVNTSDCVGKSSKELFSYVARELGWKEVECDSNDSKRPSIFCVMQSADLLRRLSRLTTGSWISRYPGAPDVCDKGNFARMVRSASAVCSENFFSFLPRTWTIPDELPELRATLEKSKGTFIVKPEDGSQGDGIFLVRGLRNFDVKISTSSVKAVVQKYISKPLLLGGLKFDLRMYVLVAGGTLQSPPVIQLCKEGLARFCTEAYEAPNQMNMHLSMRHLTNYSLNKRSQKFEHCCSDVYGENFSSKRPLTVCLRQLSQEHPDFDEELFYSHVQIMCQRSVALMAPVILRDAQRSFQILGFDIMLDHKYRAYLLEVNNSPSLCIDEALLVDADSVDRKLCRCMDMAQPHWHQTSLVDLEVKSELLASGLGSGAVATVGSFGGVLPWSQKLRQQRFAADLRTTVWRQAKET